MLAHIALFAPKLSLVWRSRYEMIGCVYWWTATDVSKELPTFEASVCSIDNVIKWSMQS